MKENWNKKGSSGLGWTEQVYNDLNLWDCGASEYLPSITAHEYERLRELFRQGQAYGALLQIKDVIELLIKVPVIIVVAEVVNTGLDKRTEFYGLLYNMLKETLSFGHWRNIAGKILKVITKECVMYKLLQDIYTACLEDDPIEGYVDVVKWRNSRIGHGALMFDENEQFREEMMGLLKLIKNHLSRSADLYAKVKLIDYREDKKKSGVLSNRRLLSKVGDSDCFSLSPFMEIIANKIYCFDTYLHDKKKVDMLDYVDASKIKQSIKFLDDLYADLCYNLNIKNMGKDEIGRTYLTEEERLFLTNSKEDKYIKPAYLFDWLEKMLSDNKSGVYFLKMMSGMGKSTFVKMLDNHSFIDKKYKKNLGEHSVRAYYINSAYSSDVKKFMFDLQDCLRKDDSGRSISGEGRYFNNKQSFAEMLNYYHDEYAGRSVECGRFKSNLLVIIDGLDEAVMVEGNSIIDFIPDPDMLAEGVHILLSCRTDEELPANIYSKVQGLKTTGNYVIDKDDWKNKALINEYIYKILGINDIGIVELMNGIIDQRMLRAKLLNYMPEIVKHYNFLDSKEICKVFLDKLKFIYSEKYFVRIRKILLILAMSEVPLNVHQVSKIMRDAKFDFQLLGMFNDIMPLLEKTGTNSGACFTISHQDFRGFIFDYFAADAEKLQLELIQATNELIISVEKLEFEDYLTIYFAYKYTKEVLPDLMKYIQVDSFLFHTANKLKQDIEYDGGSYQNYVICEICRKIISILSYGEITFDGNDGDIRLDLHIITRLTCDYNIAIVFFHTRNYNMARTMFTDIVESVQSRDYTGLECVEAISEKAQIYLTKISDISYKKSLVEEAKEVEGEIKQAIIYDNVGRNKACPCGSGKKYKNCCMIKTTLATDTAYESELDSFLGLDIGVSQHDVFGGVREFTLAVFDSVIQNVEQKENVDIKMLVRLFLTVKFLLVNGYHCRANPSSFGSEEFYEFISYDAITNFFGDCYQFKNQYRSKIAYSYRNKNFEKEFTNCERLCLISFINSFILGQNYEKQVSIGIRLNDTQAEVSTDSVFNRAWKNDFILLYRLIKSRRMADYEGGIMPRIFGSQSRSVLGWDIRYIPYNALPLVSSMPEFTGYVGSWWKQVVYDYNLTYLSNIFGLKEETIDALKILIDNRSVYHDYVGSTLAELYIVEKQEEMFLAVGVNYQSIKNIFLAIEVEYMDLVNLLSGEKVDNVDQAYEYLFNLKKIEDKHYKVLSEFRIIAKDFNQSSIISDVITSLKEIMFDKKMAIYISDFAKQLKISKNIALICEMTKNKRATGDILKLVKPSYKDIEILLNS